VLPAPQTDGRATLWELTSDRFTKQIKAGANAGQPSALSALISLYLGQAVVASEEEIESFLSPLVARSRTRSVIHALLGARQLDSIAVEGRTMLHLAGELPAFLGAAKPEADAATVEVDAIGASTEPSEEASETPRITKFVAKPKKIGTGYLGKASPAKFASSAKFGSKPAFKLGFGSKSGFKPGFASKSGAAPDRERRPFAKGPIPATGFDKPWEEEKARRLAAAAKPSDMADAPAGDMAAASAGEVAAVRPARTYKPREDSARRGVGERRPAFGSKPSFGTKPAFGGKPGFGAGRSARPSFRPRAEGAGETGPPRKTFSKPGTFGRKREGIRDQGSGISEQRPRPGAFGRKPSFGEGRPPRRDFAPRPGGGDRPSAGGFREPRKFSSAPRGDDGRFAPRKPAGGGFGTRPSFGKSGPSGDRAARSGDRSERGAGAEGAKRVYRKFDAPRDKPARTFSSDRTASDRGSERPARKPFAKPAGSGFGAKRPSGKPAAGGKKPFAKPGGSFAGKPSSPFAKFADGNKPFGKRPPARKFKPKEGENA